MCACDELDRGDVLVLPVLQATLPTFIPSQLVPTRPSARNHVTRPVFATRMASTVHGLDWTATSTSTRLLLGQREPHPGPRQHLASVFRDAVRAAGSISMAGLVGTTSAAAAAPRADSHQSLLKLSTRLAIPGNGSPVIRPVVKRGSAHVDHRFCIGTFQR
jgi:hypothetical protein